MRNMRNFLTDERRFQGIVCRLQATRIHRRIKTVWMRSSEIGRGVHGYQHSPFAPLPQRPFPRLDAVSRGSLSRGKSRTLPINSNTPNQCSEKATVPQWAFSRADPSRQTPCTMWLDLGGYDGRSAGASERRHTLSLSTHKQRSPPCEDGVFLLCIRWFFHAGIQLQLRSAPWRQRHCLAPGRPCT